MGRIVFKPPDTFVVEWSERAPDPERDRIATISLEELKAGPVHVDEHGRKSRPAPSPPDQAGSAPEAESIRIKCDSCFKLLSIPPKYAGQTGKCKHCGVKFTVPLIPGMEKLGPAPAAKPPPPPIPSPRKLDPGVRLRPWQTLDEKCQKCGSVTLRIVDRYFVYEPVRFCLACHSPRKKGCPFCGKKSVGMQRECDKCGCQWGAGALDEAQIVFNLPSGLLPQVIEQSFTGGLDVELIRRRAIGRRMLDGESEKEALAWVRAELKRQGIKVEGQEERDRFICRTCGKDTMALRVTSLSYKTHRGQISYERATNSAVCISCNPPPCMVSFCKNPATHVRRRSMPTYMISSQEPFRIARFNVWTCKQHKPNSIRLNLRSIIKALVQLGVVAFGITLIIVVGEIVYWANGKQSFPDLSNYPLILLIEVVVIVVGWVFATVLEPSLQKKPEYCAPADIPDEGWE